MRALLSVVAVVTLAGLVVTFPEGFALADHHVPAPSPTAGVYDRVPDFVDPPPQAIQYEALPNAGPVEAQPAPTGVAALNFLGEQLPTDLRRRDRRSRRFGNITNLPRRSAFTVAIEDGAQRMVQQRRQRAEAARLDQQNAMARVQIDAMKRRIRYLELRFIRGRPADVAEVDRRVRRLIRVEAWKVRREGGLDRFTVENGRVRPRLSDLPADGQATVSAMSNRWMNQQDASRRAQLETQRLDSLVRKHEGKIWDRMQQAKVLRKRVLKKPGT